MVGVGFLSLQEKKENAQQSITTLIDWIDFKMVLV